jgi:Na+/phosphate symporter
VSEPPEDRAALAGVPPAPALPAVRLAAASWRRAILLGVALYGFVLALELLKQGARGLEPLLRALDVSGLAGGLGFGWLMACVVLSGSPVAAIALTLLAAGTLTTLEAFAMIGGSRLGASFVVLAVGVLDDLRSGRTARRSAYVGVAAFVVTALVYVPALGLGYLGLERGALLGLRFGGADLASVVDRLWGPVTALAAERLPRLLVFLLGIAALLGAFRTFDALLPDLQHGPSPLARIGRVVYRPLPMFLAGAGVTSLTLSVSVSLSLLVPLTAKGYVRRENVFPYILGANVTTFIDTLFAGALVGHPDAIRVVALQMAAVSALSLPVVVLFPYAFQRLVDRIARAATASPKHLLAFVALLLLAPALLLAL